MSFLIARPLGVRAVLAAILTFCTFAMPLGARAAGLTVTGSVTSDDGVPIAGATVVLSRDGESIAARSDAHGLFTLQAGAGTFTLRAGAPGFASLSKTVSIDAGNATLALTLARATVNSLTVIGHVTASSHESVSTGSGPSLAIAAQNLAAAAQTSIAPAIGEELSTTPVLPLGGGSNATVAYAIRGPDPTETLVDIDGHQVNNGTTGDYNVALVDPAALQDVQLIYGISPSSLLGPNTIGGAINIQTLQPTTTPHALVRAFGGSFGSFGETVQTTGTSGLFGYALSFHGTSSNGSVNQTILAPLPSGGDEPVAQSVGSGSSGTSLLSKLRYQVGGPRGYGYVQVSVRNQATDQDLSALLTNYTPASAGVPGAFQSFSGTTLAAHQSNYGFDALLPLGAQLHDGAPATTLTFSHLTSLNAQSVGGPGAQTQPALYNQRDSLGDDWLQVDHHFANGTLTLKYDLGTEGLTTDYVQGQGHAELQPAPPGSPVAIRPSDGSPSGGDQAPGASVENIAQTQRSAVLRYDGDLTPQLHVSLAGYASNFSTFGSSFDPRAGLVWTPNSSTAIRASVGTTFQTPSLAELIALPQAQRVPVGGVIYVGNPNLKPDRATEYDLGFEKIFGTLGHQFDLSGDLYRSNLRGPSSQLNVTPVPGCQTTSNPAPCPLSYPVNAGSGVYQGFELRASQQIGANFRARAGWSVNSSYLTSIPPEIQDGTLLIGQQTLGQPLQEGYVALERDVRNGFAYGARLDYAGRYNALNRAPYATLDAHLAYRVNGYEFGLYGTNLTNANAYPFTVIGGGVPYGALAGQPMTSTDAYALQGSKVMFVLTKSI